MFIVRVLFMKCAFTAVVSVSFQAGRLQVSVNEINETLLDLLEETCTPIGHSFSRLIIDFICTHFHLSSSKSEFGILL